MICSDPSPSVQCAGELGTEADSTAQRSSDSGNAIESQPGESCATGADPADDAATLANSPTVPTTRREFEHALRERLGFTKRQAAAIAARGFSSRDSGDEADTGDDDTDQLAKLSAALRLATKAKK